MEKITHLVKHFYGDFKKSAVIRNAGYLGDQWGIMNRYLREKDNWQPHLEHTRQFIIDTIAQCDNKLNVAVLGSGWLLDIPIEELAKNYNQVDLFDIAHPAQVIHKTQKFGNVRHIKLDLTGGLIMLAGECKTFQQFTDRLPVNQPEINLNSYSLVISVNLLNQLDIILCDFLKKKFRIENNQLCDLRKMIQEQHICYLPVGKSCLITDFFELNIHDKTNEKEEKNLIYCNLPQSFNEQNWEWIFETHQTYHRNLNTIFKVKALRF